MADEEVSRRIAASVRQGVREVRRVVEAVWTRFEGRRCDGFRQQGSDRFVAAV